MRCKLPPSRGWWPQGPWQAHNGLCDQGQAWQTVGGGGPCCGPRWIRSSGVRENTRAAAGQRACNPRPATPCALSQLLLDSSILQQSILRFASLIGINWGENICVLSKKNNPPLASLTWLRSSLIGCYLFWLIHLDHITKHCCPCLKDILGMNATVWTALSPYSFLMGGSRPRPGL